jgi:hypothetical protein
MQSTVMSVLHAGKCAMYWRLDFPAQPVSVALVQAMRPPCGASVGYRIEGGSATSRSSESSAMMCSDPSSG